jgi:hypothetical protein
MRAALTSRRALSGRGRGLMASCCRCWADETKLTIVGKPTAPCRHSADLRHAHRRRTCRAQHRPAHEPLMVIEAGEGIDSTAADGCGRLESLDSRRTPTSTGIDDQQERRTARPGRGRCIRMVSARHTTSRGPRLSASLAQCATTSGAHPPPASTRSQASSAAMRVVAERRIRALSSPPTTAPFRA